MILTPLPSLKDWFVFIFYVDISNTFCLLLDGHWDEWQAASANICDQQDAEVNGEFEEDGDNFNVSAGMVFSW